MHDDEIAVDESLVRSLLKDQFPYLADHPLTVVEPWGTSNAIWRLGDDLVIRLPRIESAAGQVHLEHSWLPVLGRHLTVPIPAPVAVGQPGCGYPLAWAVHRWLPGNPAAFEDLRDPVRFAEDLAQFISELRTIPAHGAPPARNRARPLREYDTDTRAAIAGAAQLIDATAALRVWEEALAAPPHRGASVWVHGDLEGNCLLNGGQLAGIVDWGSACVGDPALDVQVIWSPLFDEASRHRFLDVLAVDDATVARSRGAAIHQACAALPYYLDTFPLIVERSWHKLAQLGVGPTPAP